MPKSIFLNLLKKSKKSTFNFFLIFSLLFSLIFSLKLSAAPNSLEYKNRWGKRISITSLTLKDTTTNQDLTISETNLPILTEGHEYLLTFEVRNMGNSSFFGMKTLDIAINGVGTDYSFGLLKYKGKASLTVPFTATSNKSGANSDKFLLITAIMNEDGESIFEKYNEIENELIFDIKSATHTVTLKEDLDGTVTEITPNTNPIMAEPNTLLKNLPNLPSTEKEKYVFLGFYKENAGTSTKIDADFPITEDTVILLKYTKAPIAKTDLSIFWGDLLEEPKNYISNLDELKNLVTENTFRWKEPLFNTKTSETVIQPEMIVTYTNDGTDRIETTLPISITVKPLKDLYTPKINEPITIFWGETLPLAESLIQFDGKVPNQKTVSYPPFDTKQHMDAGIVELTVHYEDKSFDMVNLPLTIKPLSEKYTPLAKKDIIQYAGKKPLLPENFVYFSETDTNLPDAKHTKYSFKEDINWNTAGKKNVTIIVTYEDQSFDEVLSDINLKRNLIIEEDEASYFSPSPAEPEKEKNDETQNQADEKQPEKNTDIPATEVTDVTKENSSSPVTEITEENNDFLVTDVTEDATPQGSTTLNTNSTKKKDKDKTSLTSLNGKKIISNETVVKKENPYQTKAKVLLAKTGGENIKLFLVLNVLLALISALGFLSFFKKG